jgi:hypothetical protein
MRRRGDDPQRENGMMNRPGWCNWLIAVVLLGMACVIVLQQHVARKTHEEVLTLRRLPDGWRNVSAKVDKTELKPDKNRTVDISQLKEKRFVCFQVAKSTDK